MNKKYFLHIVSALSMMIFFSCEEEIEVKVPDLTEKLVVEGKIENGLPPCVYLTRSSKFFGTTDLNDMEKYYVHDAFITIYSETDSVILQEYNTDQLSVLSEEDRIKASLAFNIPVLDPIILSGFVKIYFYAPPVGSSFVGEVGKTYKMKVVHGDNIYTAQTTIPITSVVFDTLYKEPADVEEIKSTHSLLRGKLKDPSAAGTFYKYTTRTNYQPWLFSFQSVFDDAFINGDSINVFIPKGLEFYEILQDFRDLPASTGYWANEDTSIVKLSIIDKPTYDFWRTLENNRQNQGSPFGNTVLIKGNISGNNVIGIWGGYNSTENVLFPSAL